MAGPGRGRGRPAGERRGGPARRMGTRSGVRDRPRGDAAADDDRSRGHRDDLSRQPHGVVSSRYRRSAGMVRADVPGRRRRAAILYRHPGDPGLAWLLISSLRMINQLRLVYDILEVAISCRCSEEREWLPPGRWAWAGCRRAAWGGWSRSGSSAVTT